MIAVIPLAGADFDHPALSTLKPLMPIDGVPLVERAIASRRWWQSGELQSTGLIFVLRQTPETRSFSRQLRNTYPGCRIVTLSDMTRGPLLSAIAGVTVADDLSEPLVIDSADLLYGGDSERRIEEQFSSPGSPDALVPAFPSDDPRHSYAMIDPGHPAGTRIRRTASREVISAWATAGICIFRSAALFLAAAGCSLIRADAEALRNVWSVGPVINELINLGYEARIEKVRLINPVSLQLKEQMQTQEPTLA